MFGIYREKVGWLIPWNGESWWSNHEVLARVFDTREDAEAELKSDLELVREL
jgi:hypothetical protein